MHLPEFIKRKGVKQVTSQQIHEASTNRLHPEGLFSEDIFGSIGSTNRLIRFGYIDIHTTIFHPTIFANLIELRGLYKEVMSGKTYVKFSDEIKDLIICPKDDPDAETGYQYFMEIFPKIVFKPTKSDKRNDKIKMLHKYSDRLTMNTCIVSPAGIRDLEETSDGRFISEEINDIYRSILSLSAAIPKDLSDHPIFNSVRFNLQMKVSMVYDHIFSITDGKKGYFQNKYMARKLAGGTRNVFVSAILEGTDPDDPRYLKPDETYVALFQTMRMYDKIIKYYLRHIFFNNSIGNNTNKIPAVDPDTGNLVYIEISDIERNKYMTDDGLNDYINDFKNKDIRFEPVSILDIDKKPYYPFMIFDDIDKVYIYRDKADLHEYVQRTRTSVNKIQHLNNLIELGLEQHEYVILGSACTILYGMNKINNDIDIFVTPEALQRILPKLTETDKGYTDTATGTIDISDVSSMYNNFEEAYVHSTVVDGYRFLDISGLLSFYEALYETFKMPKHKSTLDWVRQLNETMFIDADKLRPMTIYELFYITTYMSVQYGANQKHLFNTRYPVAHIESIYPSKTHVVTTTPSRLVYLSSLLDDSLKVALPHYPILHEESMDALALHPSWLENLTADFDGDMGNGTGAISVEANEEIAAYMNSPASIVNTRGDLIAGIHDDTMIPWVLNNMSRDRVKAPVDLSRFKPSLNRIQGVDQFRDLMPINQTILSGTALLSVLGLMKTSSLECVVNDYVFDVLGRSGKFEYRPSGDVYTALNGYLNVYKELPNGADYIYDQLVFNVVRIDSVLFLSPKIHYKMCKNSPRTSDQKIAELYHKYLPELLK